MTIVQITTVENGAELKREVPLQHALSMLNSNFYDSVVIVDLETDEVVATQ